MDKIILDVFEDLQSIPEVNVESSCKGIRVDVSTISNYYDICDSSLSFLISPNFQIVSSFFDRDNLKSEYIFYSVNKHGDRLKKYCYQVNLKDFRDKSNLDNYFKRHLQLNREVFYNYMDCYRKLDDIHDKILYEDTNHEEEYSIRCKYNICISIHAKMNCNSSKYDIREIRKSAKLIGENLKNYECLIEHIKSSIVSYGFIVDMTEDTYDYHRNIRFDIVDKVRQTVITTLDFVINIYSSDISLSPRYEETTYDIQYFQLDNERYHKVEDICGKIDEIIKHVSDLDFEYLENRH